MKVGLLQRKKKKGRRYAGRRSVLSSLPLDLALAGPKSGREKERREKGEVRPRGKRHHVGIVVLISLMPYW